MLVRSCRYASARGENPSPVMRGASAPCGSSGTAPSTGAAVSAVTWARVPTVRSRLSRSTAAPSPRPRPTSRPSATSRPTRGEVGRTGVAAARVSRTDTGEAAGDVRVPGDSSRPTIRGNCSATASAMSRARVAEVSRTLMSTSTVSSGLLAVTASARSAAVIGRCSCVTTGWSTAGLSTRSV